MLSIDPDDDDDDVPTKSGQQTPAGGGGAGPHTPAGVDANTESGDMLPTEGPSQTMGGVDPSIYQGLPAGLVDCTVDLTKDVDEEAQEASSSYSSFALQMLAVQHALPCYMSHCLPIPEDAGPLRVHDQHPKACHHHLN